MHSFFYILFFCILPTPCPKKSLGSFVGRGEEPPRARGLVWPLPRMHGEYGYSPHRSTDDGTGLYLPSELHLLGQNVLTGVELLNRCRIIGQYGILPITFSL